MSALRVSMRKIKEVLRLWNTAKLSHRQIAAAVGLARSTVADYLKRAEASGLGWPLPQALDDADIDRLLFTDPLPSSIERPQPDFDRIHQELRRKGVTLLLLWNEYSAQHPEAMRYSRFCDCYRQWRGALDVVMRQNHKAGERLFVDYAGLTMPVIDPTTGQVRTAQIFVATLGASSYTYAEATWTQATPDWIGSHRRAFAFFGGVPEIVVPDNLKSGVNSPHRYDPEINRTYAEFAEHYGVAVIPARSRTPRDKAKVESGVQVVEQSILAPLRDHTFVGLSELNQAIARLLEDLNNRPFQKLPGSRRLIFEATDRPALRPLPDAPFMFAEWKKARVNIDYHLEIDGHYYSVPYKYARQQLDVRFTDSTVECFLGSRRIASHPRSFTRGQHTTTSEHMPRSHQQYAGWTPERIQCWAASIGSATAQLVERIISARAHPVQGYRTCLGILRLAKPYGAERLEAAAVRALAIGATTYKSVASILEHGLDQQALPFDAQSVSLSIPIDHENIRGAHYYTQPCEGPHA